MIHNDAQWNTKNQKKRKMSVDKEERVCEISASTLTQPVSPTTPLKISMITSSIKNDDNNNNNNKNNIKCIRINNLEEDYFTNGKCDKIISNNNKKKIVQSSNKVHSTFLVQTSKKRRRLRQKSPQSFVNNVNFWRTKFPLQKPSICDLIKILPVCFHISVLVFLWCINLDIATATLSSSTTTAAATATENAAKPIDKYFSSVLGSYAADDDVDLHQQSAFNTKAENEGYDGHYTHTWAVHVPNGEDNDLANNVARDHGFINLGKIFGDHYHFAHQRIVKRSLMPSISHQSRLENDNRVVWAQQQKAKSRQKRDFTRMRASRTSPRGLSLVDAMPFSDPNWSTMWYLNRGGGLDMNVIPAWKEGITGEGIVVTILDDGLESDHPDIKDNYDPLASYDVNNHDDDPMPHYDLTDSNRHGTRCAGEVAATANNSYCAVGIAYGARVGGVRMLDGDVTDAVEARSLSHNMHHVDIYSASWGPDDDGKTVDGPGELASRAFIEGVTKGRNGKGSIFIWASGNGGREYDNCNCDGYTNSIWTLSISSATEGGHVPWYSEKCSSTLATTYSSGGQGEKQVVTTDLHHTCTLSHTGTSASAPLAAGIAALVLQSNPNLTWRDLQHIVVRTAKPANLKDPTWSRNGVGRRISHSFGYGLMDAAAMVRVARTWKTVPEQQRCEINAPHVDKVIPPKSYIRLQLTVKFCDSIKYLEHVQAKISLTTPRRGDIELYLKSPAGTKVTLLTSRAHDNSRTGFNQWPFMSVHTWGESPLGNWQLEIHNEGKYMAQITQWDLLFYGTKTLPNPDNPLVRNHDQNHPFVNDIVQNEIESDASSQWHNKQTGEINNVISSDISNTSCVQTSTDQRCLACSSSTFLFDGRCLMECPGHTFPYSQTQLDGELNLDRLSNSVENIENDMPNEHANISNTCNTCDKSCNTCYGPLSSQCSSCYVGSQLRKQAQGNENYCFVLTERSSGNGEPFNTTEASTSMDLRTFTGLAQLILFLVPFLTFALLIVLIIALFYLKAKNAKKSNICDNYKRNIYDHAKIHAYKDEATSEEKQLFMAPNVEVYEDKNDNEQAISMHSDSECDDL